LLLLPLLSLQPDHPLFAGFRQPACALRLPLDLFALELALPPMHVDVLALGFREKLGNFWRICDLS
jgi:hypothetical protein